MGHNDLRARAAAEHNGLCFLRPFVDLLPAAFQRRALVLRKLINAAALDGQHERQPAHAIK